MIEEDKELQEMQEMELAFKQACDLHRQYEISVIHRRVRFQKDCPHNEIRISEHVDLIQDALYTMYHCARCNKFIKREKK